MDGDPLAVLDFQEIDAQGAGPGDVVGLVEAELPVTPS